MSLFFEDDEDDIYAYFPGEYVYGDDMCVPEEYMGEKWWYIDGIYNEYMVSTMGRVWSSKTQKFLKVKPMDRVGHLGVCLHINGRPRYEYIHRLMAKAFIPNPDNYPIVRHLNDIKDDNSLENLAWGTQKDNMQDAIQNERFYYFSKADRKKCVDVQLKPIIATNIKTRETIKFKGQTEAARILNLQQSNIWKVLNGKRAHTEGWYFEYL